jgi:LETM1 and EF-hand domain-containing protein 1
MEEEAAATATTQIQIQRAFVRGPSKQQLLNVRRRLLVESDDNRSFLFDYGATSLRARGFACHAASASASISIPTTSHGWGHGRRILAQARAELGLSRDGSAASAFSTVTQQQQQPKPPSRTLSAGSQNKNEDEEGERVDAEDCHLSIESLDDVEEKLARKKLISPSSFPKRVMKTVVFLYGGLKYTLGVFVAMGRGMGKMSRYTSEQWRGKFKEWGCVLKDMAKHYWVGFKLLWTETKIASKYVGKALRGKVLSRRERRQLTRTTADMFRMVPMLIFLVIPFMELLLPVALTLFPNMLPSTFQDKLKEEEKMKKKLRLKLEVASFLQDTVDEMASGIKQKKGGKKAARAEALKEFIQKIRGGEVVTNDQISQFAKLFNDEFTLDNLSRVHLVNMCKFAGLTPFGTDVILREQLRAHLRAIKDDDILIRSEGIEVLSPAELRDACRARGMRAAFGSESVPYMQKQMKEWIDLSLNRNLPSSLLLLSRAFIFTHSATRSAQVMNAVKETISTLPDEVVSDVQTSLEDEKSPAEKKLEYLQSQEELIAEEEIQMKEHEEMETSKIEEDFAAKKAKKLKKVASALAVLASASTVDEERQAFVKVVDKGIKAYQEKLAEKAGAQLLFSGGKLIERRPAEEPEDPDESAAQSLSKKVSSMLHRLDKELDDVEQKVKTTMKVVDKDDDGLVTKEEVLGALGFLKEEMGEEDLQNFIERLDIVQSSSTTGHIDFKELLDTLEGKEDSGGGNWVPPAMRKFS